MTKTAVETVFWFSLSSSLFITIVITTTITLAIAARTTSTGTPATLRLKSMQHNITNRDHSLLLLSLLLVFYSNLSVFLQWPYILFIIEYELPLVHGRAFSNAKALSLTSILSLKCPACTGSWHLSSKFHPAFWAAIRSSVLSSTLGTTLDIFSFYFGFVSLLHNVFDFFQYLFSLFINKIFLTIWWKSSLSLSLTLSSLSLISFHF